MAEKEGFEPSLRFSHTTPLAGEPLEPLGYFCMALSFFQSYNTISHFLTLVKAFCPKNKKTFSKIIFSKFALPKILKRMSMTENECVVTPDGVDAVVRRYIGTTGIRDLEQAAEHIAANALYQIEVEHATTVTFDADMVKNLL